MSDWQPIDTAPKDGSRILAYTATRQVIIIKRHDVGGRYETWVDDHQYPAMPKLLMWQPLPAPPEAK
jgi:hypothetical protein